MSTTTQKQKDEWEKERVQRVIDYHNKKYGTNIAIKDKATEVYLRLKGQINWDWVCYDAKTGDEIAVEVKTLRDEKLENRGNIIWQLLEEIRNDLSNKLPGTFSLYIDIPKNFYLPIGKIKEPRNRQEFKNTLYKEIYETAQRLKSGEEKGLTPQIIEQLPFALPDSFFCALQKVSEEGSVLGLGSGVTGWWHQELSKDESDRFNRLISDANTQLEQANAKQKLLVFIDISQRPISSAIVAETFKRINHASYSYINHIYYVSGEEVIEIPLPVTP